MDTFLLIFVSLIFYVVLLFMLRYRGFLEKKSCESCLNCCPDCKNAMVRIKRNRRDYLVNHFTFHIFNFKRYKCKECSFEGLRWEKQSRPGKN